MAHRIGMTRQLAGNAARFAYYTGMNWAMSRTATRYGTPPRYKPERSVPTRQEMLADLRALMVADAEAVRDGIFPPSDEDGGNLPEHMMRVRAMFADLPKTMARRAERETASAKAEPPSETVPDYYAQDFHFQTGGYLSEESAKLYDVQVETLFSGAASAMRRVALRPIAAYLAAHDQRKCQLLDVACGTGRWLRDVRLAFPALHLTGLDLSSAYIDEARAHLRGLRPATFLADNAEAMPFDDASQDIVTSIFLYHELPPEVRRTVTAEIARVLKPGGVFVFVESLQMGDKPGWDGLLEAFPVRFHEPYFRHYATDDLEGMFSAAGLAPKGQLPAFMSKVMVRQKAM